MYWYRLTFFYTQNLGTYEMPFTYCEELSASCPIDAITRSYKNLYDSKLEWGFAPESYHCLEISAIQIGA